MFRSLTIDQSGWILLSIVCATGLILGLSSLTNEPKRGKRDVSKPKTSKGSNSTFLKPQNCDSDDEEVLERSDMRGYKVI